MNRKEAKRPAIRGRGQPRPLWSRPLLVIAATLGVGLVIAWAATGGLRSISESASHPWIRNCMGQPPALTDASFYFPPIHSAERRYCLNSPSVEAAAVDSGRSFAERRDLTRIEVWDARAKRYLLLRGHTGRVRCFALSETQLLTASDSAADTAVRLWSLETGQVVQRFDAGRPACWGGFGFMGFSPGRQLVVTATDDRVVRIWDSATGRPAGSVVPGEGLTRFAFSPDRSILALGGFSGDISLWSWRSGRQLIRWHAHDRFDPSAPDTGGVESLEFSPDGKQLRSSGPVDGEPAQRVWDVASGRLAAG